MSSFSACLSASTRQLYKKIKNIDTTDHPTTHEVTIGINISMCGEPGFCECLMEDQVHLIIS